MRKNFFIRVVVEINFPKIEKNFDHGPKLLPLPLKYDIGGKYDHLPVNPIKF